MEKITITINILEAKMLSKILGEVVKYLQAMKMFHVSRTAITELKERIDQELLKQ